MSELRGHSILIVVDGEISALVNALQEEIERAGADALVVGDHPDAIADTLATFDFTAAAVNGENQDVVAQLNLPTVIVHDADTPPDDAADKQTDENADAQTTATSTDKHTQDEATDD